MIRNFAHQGSTSEAELHGKEAEEQPLFLGIGAKSLEMLFKKNKNLQQKPFEKTFKTISVIRRPESM